MKNSGIEWTDHTFNPWMGCTKVSPGCAHCYAEALSKRAGRGEYTRGVPRVRTSAANWKQPLKWNREVAERTYGGNDYYPAAKMVRPRVFCASLADWLDDEVPIEWLIDLLTLIDDTPNLDWLLLTKRPQNWFTRIDQACKGNISPFEVFRKMPNIWVGVTVEDQARADERIPRLLQIPAKVRFLSCEPLLENINIGLDNDNYEPMKSAGGGIHWVICGGESGHRARHMQIDWADDLRAQCIAANVPFFMKQLGGVKDKRHAMEDFPATLRVREFPGERMIAAAEQIEQWLLSQPGWVKGRDLCCALGIQSDRHLRDDGDVPGLLSGFAISHTRKGYRHYLKATTREWLQFKHSRRRHGFREFRRIAKMQGRRHDDRQGVLL